jgi:hypothetical protein
MLIVLVVVLLLFSLGSSGVALQSGLRILS